MKIPKTDKIIKAELTNIDNGKSNVAPKTLSFRTNEKSHYHFEKVKKELEKVYGTKFSNTDVIEFALAFAFENFVKREDSEE